MPFATIHKPRNQWRVRPHLLDYDAARAEFSWSAARQELGGLSQGRTVNLAHLAVDQHAEGPRADHVALRWLGKKDERRELSYAKLRAETNRFANVLRGLGVGPGDRVFALMPRVPELYIGALGTLKNRSVLSPLFPAFGPEPIRQRIALGEGSVLLTTDALYRRKVAGIRDQIPSLRHVIVVRTGEAETAGADDYHTLMAAASDAFEISPTDPEDLALLHFTSGTTGRPKGAMHVHGAGVAHYVSSKLALDFHRDDVFWCTADPGWVTGTSYGILAPLMHGITNVVDEADFDASRWYRILDEEAISVWYTAPTAVRMLMKLGPGPAEGHAFPGLRFAASVGEPLNPEAVEWGRDALGVPIHDNWWQTETGTIMIANYAGLDIRPGSMGLPLPGIDAAVVERVDGEVRAIEKPGAPGELALRSGWPSMFRGYYHEESRYAQCFADHWYLTGDLASRDADGYFWFLGRADDVIKSAGHLIGPFEVESALLEHEAVAEAGVIGSPDSLVGEVVKAFVALKPGFDPSDALRRELLAHGRMRLGAQIAPKELEFATELPKTRSGKIMRRLLKARDLGLPEGDLSTLEQPGANGR